MGEGAEGATEFVVSVEIETHVARRMVGNALVVVFPVLDMIPAHDFYFTEVDILLPLFSRKTRGGKEKRTHVRLKSRLF